MLLRHPKYPVTGSMFSLITEETIGNRDRVALSRLNIFGDLFVLQSQYQPGCFLSSYPVRSTQSTSSLNGNLLLRHGFPHERFEDVPNRDVERIVRTSILTNSVMVCVKCFRDIPRITQN